MANCFISGEKFILNATTGALIVNGTLDREIAQFYHLQITVRNLNPKHKCVYFGRRDAKQTCETILRWLIGLVHFKTIVIFL